ncbi:MAG TPA: MFS transporter [Burkholderiaceae bacterium]
MSTSSLAQSDSADSGAHPQVSPGEIAVGVVIGRASEYFDFFVFGIACSLVFPSEFFPFLPRLDATLWSFVIFAFAFIARPVGTLLAMELQRRFSRETKLTAALFLLGTCTAGIAFLPGYDSLGAASIVLLALLRIGQGLALGGSWDGLPSLLALHAPPQKRGWYAMLGQLGAPLGFVMAASLFAFLVGNLDSADFLDWGWRYPFFVAFAVNVVALFARLQLVANEEFSGMLVQRELEPVRLSDMPRSQVANLFIGAFAALASFALFHLVTVFPLSWITLFTKVPVTEFLVIQIVGGFIAAAATVGSGLLADRLGRRNTLASLAICIAVFSGFTPVLLAGGKLGAYVFIILGFALLGLSYGQAAGAVTSNFETRFRYIGAALTSDLAWLIGAAFAPVVALGLSAQFGLAWVSVYLLSGAAGTLAALWINKALMTRD